MPVTHETQRIRQTDGNEVTVSITTSVGMQQLSAWTGSSNMALERGNFTLQSGTRPSLSDVTALASEEALGRVWNRPAEDEAWRNL
jgi:hypothetical protein